jgi:two-component system phosphate regulon response regulator PhoB
VFEDLIIDLSKKTCHIDEQEIPLTKKEFEILILLLRHQNKILSREEILNRVWSDDVIVLGRTIDVNITRLRKKIGRYGKHIVTRLGYGYGFEV